MRAMWAMLELMFWQQTKLSLKSIGIQKAVGRRTSQRTSYLPPHMDSQFTHKDSSLLEGFPRGYSIQKLPKCTVFQGEKRFGGSIFKKIPISSYSHPIASSECYFKFSGNSNKFGFEKLFFEKAVMGEPSLIEEVL